MDPIAMSGLVVSAAAMLMAIWALRRAARALADERVARLSAAEAAEAAARLTAGRIEAIERRVGRGRRLTPEKRNRALQLLAHGASQTVIARELDMREAEVAALARLRSQGGITRSLGSAA
jgi:hypothetical protein